MSTKHDGILVSRYKESQESSSIPAKNVIVLIVFTVA